MTCSSVTYIDHMGTDLSVVNAARVSFGKKSEALGASGIVGEPMKPILHDVDKKLIKYLAKHRHMSPFGHAFASFHVKAPIFVARQLVKHKFLRWNEISRRYVKTDPEFYYPDHYRQASDDKKQGSGDRVSDNVGNAAIKNVTRHTAQCLIQYQNLLSDGVCEEQARMVLPQSTMTEWYWSGSLDAFSDMCNLRCKEDTQLETARTAQCVSQAMQKLFPLSWEALTND